MRRVASFVALAALLALPVSTARAGEKERCVAASEQGQELRDSGNYRRAREAFAACARDSCPALVRRDCTVWQSELEDSWPSVIVAAKDGSGNDLVEVRVTLDGAPLLSRLDGQPARVDPGEHMVRLEADGFRAAEQRIVVGAGEKDRLVQVQLVPLHAASAADDAADRAHSPASADGGDATHPGAGKRTSAFVFGALALTAFATEAYFGLTGISDRSALMSSPCAQDATCSPSSVDSIRTKFTVADISLGVGLASAALATYLFFTSSSSGADPADAPAKSARVDFAPLRGGGAASIVGRF